METIKIKLIEKIQRSESVLSCRFSSGTKKINFEPGQFLQVIFNEANPNDKTLNKYLSFSSSPTKDYIEITKRISQSLFSERLSKLNLNDEVLIKYPMGNCVFDPSHKKLAFLAGGIGITPVISIVEYIYDKKIDTDLVILYANKSELEVPFKNELEHWKKTLANCNIQYFFEEQNNVQNLTPPRITKNSIETLVSDYSDRHFFVFGPPAMVNATVPFLVELGIKKEFIKKENFTGY